MKARLFTIVTVAVLVAVTATAGTNAVRVFSSQNGDAFIPKIEIETAPRTELYKHVQDRAAAKVLNAIDDDNAERALMWASTLTQLQAAEVAEVILTAKRTLVPNPEVTFPVLAKLGYGLIETELRDGGAESAEVANLIEGLLSPEMTLRALEGTVENILRRQQAEATYSAQAYALAQAMSDKYADHDSWKFKRLSDADRKAVEAMVNEGNENGWYIPNPLDDCLSWKD